MMNKLSMMFLLFALVAGNLFAQEWSVEVLDPSGAMGMGTVIKVDDKKVSDGWRYAIVATADHVVDASEGIKLRFENGKVVDRCSVIGRNRAADVALIMCKVPDGTSPLKIGTDPIEEGDVVNFVGRYRRKFSGDASSLCYKSEAWTDVVVIPGDSGGSVIVDGKLVGVISGGLRWAPNPPQRTWPCRSCNLSPLVDLVRKAEEAGDWNRSSTKTSVGSVDFVEYKSGDLKKKCGLQLVVWSAGWCNPCKNLKLELKRRKADLDELGVGRVVVVDVDLHGRLAVDNNIKLYPTTFIVKDGKILATVKGASVNDIMTSLARVGKEDE